MENSKVTKGRLTLAEDHRDGSEMSRYVILADNRMVATIVRQNYKEYGPDKTDELGILHPDPQAEANAQLFVNAKKAVEALEQSTAMMRDLYQETIGPAGTALGIQIKLNEETIKKSKGHE